VVQTYKVDIKNMSYVPESVTVAAGDTVEWTNRMPMAHTVTADDDGFDSGPIGSGQTFSQAFDAAATVAYHCEIHPGMTGTVVVT
jgi:plastocyanin